MELITKGEYAYRRLRDDIISGKYPAGFRLVVKDLVEEYEVSAMPIRNAISRLEELGLVQCSAHQGAWVAKMNLRDYFTFMLLRTDAEALAAFLAAKNRDEETLRELEDLYHKMEIARDSKDYESYGRMNRKTHKIVCAASGNQALVEQINTYMNRTRLAVSFFSIVPESSEESSLEHRDWIEALRNHDSHLSAAIIRYQRCRANLQLMYAIRDAYPTVRNNPFLKESITDPEDQQCVREFVPIFEEIKAQNDYRKF